MNNNFKLNTQTQTFTYNFALKITPTSLCVSGLFDF